MTAGWSGGVAGVAPIHRPPSTPYRKVMYPSGGCCCGLGRPLLRSFRREVVQNLCIDRPPRPMARERLFSSFRGMSGADQPWGEHGQLDPGRGLGRHSPVTPDSNAQHRYPGRLNVATIGTGGAAAPAGELYDRPERPRRSCLYRCKISSMILRDSVAFSAMTTSSLMATRAGSKSWRSVMKKARSKYSR